MGLPKRVLNLQQRDWPESWRYPDAAIHQNGAISPGVSALLVVISLPMNSSSELVFATKGSLVCRPVWWADIAKFLVFNYVLHAITVLSSPGDGALLSTMKRIFSLFIPMFGTVRALTAIHRFACGQSTPLRVALRARALCMVRYPHDYSESGNAPPTKDERFISLAVTTVQGQHPVATEGLLSWARGQLRRHRLVPIEPTLVALPPNLIVHPVLSRNSSPKFDIAYNHNIVKVLAALGQIAYASFQLVESSGPQIERYGYAAYQLTIIPYAIMSVLNLIAALCEPEFPAMFLVRRNMDSRGDLNQMSAEVGNVFETEKPSTLLRTRLKQNPVLELFLLFVCSILLAASVVGPYFLVWFLTRFERGSDPDTVQVTVSLTGVVTTPSTPGQYTVLHPWVVIWLGFNQLTSLIAFVFHLGFKIPGFHPMFSRVMGVIYGCFAVFISVYGFMSIVWFMRRDSVCIIL